MRKMPKTKRLRLNLSRLKKSKSNLEAHSLQLRGCVLMKTASCTVDRNRSNIDGEAESPREIIVQSPTYTHTPKDLHGTLRVFLRPSESNSIANEKLFTSNGTHPVKASEALAEEAMRSAWNFEDTGRTGVGRKGVGLPKDSVALTAYSMEPSKEFRQSMMEMVVSRIERNLTLDWDYLEKLVICYLELNEEKCHQYILSAFANVTVELYQIIGQIP